MAHGSIKKTCNCRDTDNRRLGKHCPRLRRPGGAWHPTHGWWAYQLEIPPAAGTSPRRQLRRTGFANRDAAEAERDHAKALIALARADPTLGGRIADLLVGLKSGQPLPDQNLIARRVGAGIAPATALTVGEYLWDWYRARKIAPTTLHGYEGHIRNYLEPYLGHIPLDELRVTDIQALFDGIVARNVALAAGRDGEPRPKRGWRSGERIVSGATMHRIRATLRKALNDAIRAHRLIEFNPAAHVELPSGKRPKAKVWTQTAIKHWQTTGERPGPVMVWTPATAGEFLDYAETHDIVLYPLFTLILHRGLRRGEAVGLRDTDIDLAAGTITIAQQITCVGNTPITKTVKSDAGDRTIVLDQATVAALRSYQARRNRWQLVSGPDWPNTGLFFVQPHGHPYHPGAVSNRFEQLIADARLPPIRLHDLRHGAATYLKAAGADLKDIQETLGHSSIAITSDTYTSVIHELDTERAKADAASALIPRTQRPA